MIFRILLNRVAFRQNLIVPPFYITALSSTENPRIPLRTELAQNLPGKPIGRGKLMNTMRGLWLGLIPGAAAIALLQGVPAFADAIYNVNLTIGTGTVKGTIDTDGATGSLALSDFKDWNLTIKDGVSSAVLLGPLSGNNSFDAMGGSAVSANANNILFDFSGGPTPDNYFFFENTSGPVDFVCFGQGGGGSFQSNCASGQAGYVEAFEINSGDNQSVPLTGRQVIATRAAIPEPASLGLFAAGLLGLCVWRRARRPQAACPAA
jgi:hypothetical protein